MAAPGDLALLDDVKAWLNLATTGDDDLLGRLITAVSTGIVTWLGRQILSADYQETRDGTGGRTLAFIQAPVSAVASLTIDDRPIPAAADAHSPGYLFSASRLSLLGYRFRPGLGNVQISYTAGYPAVPADIAQACIQLVAMRYRERDRIGLVSKGLGGETTSFVQAAMPQDVAAVLQRYRRVAPC
ncbi:MAG TPA: phage head-tail connector protein [Stellaceae bacterium]|nr:phage head-tail connector protein [Stellaceae bacterium]